MRYPCAAESTCREGRPSRHDDEDSGPALGPGEKVDETSDDLGVRGEVFEPRRVDGEGGGSRDDDDIGVESVLRSAAANGPGPAELEHLFEIHDVRGDHLLAGVNENEVVVSGEKEEVERSRRADASSTAENHDLHPSVRSSTGAAP